MKRYGHLMEKIASLPNILVADEKARKNKNNWGIKKHDLNREEEDILLAESLWNGTYETSEYDTFTIYEPKERLIFRLPYYPDRITHHAILNILEPIWVNTFVTCTYSCIKGRGIKAAFLGVKKSLKDVEGTKYCLKVDIKKFYPSIKHDHLINTIKKKIKDFKLISLLSEIIESNANGVPIGNYLSQFFANLILTPIDHKIKEVLKVKHYHRYADDMIFFAATKEELWEILEWLIKALAEIGLELKSNYQVFPVDDRGVDFVGYVFRHDHIKLRKRIKIKIYSLIRKLKTNQLLPYKFKIKMSAYYGWMQFCNTKHLLSIIRNLTTLNLIGWFGDKTIISRFYNKNIRIVVIDKRPKYYKVNFIYKDKPYSFRSKAKMWERYLSHRNFNLKLFRYGKE